MNARASSLALTDSLRHFRSRLDRQPETVRRVCAHPAARRVSGLRARRRGVPFGRHEGNSDGHGLRRLDGKLPRRSVAGRRRLLQRALELLSRVLRPSDRPRHVRSAIRGFALSLAMGLAAVWAAGETVTLPAVASISGGAPFFSDVRVFNMSYTASLDVTATYHCFIPSPCTAG